MGASYQRIWPICVAQLGLSFCPAPTLMEGLLSITLVSLVSRTPSWYTALVCLWRAKEAYTEPGARSRRCPEGEPCRWSSFSHYPGEGPLQSPRAIWGWSSQGWARFVLPKLQDSLAAAAEGTRWRSSTHSYLNLNTLERSPPSPRAALLLSDRHLLATWNSNRATHLRVQERITFRAGIKVGLLFKQILKRTTIC